MTKKELQWLNGNDVCQTLLIAGTATCILGHFIVSIIFSLIWIACAYANQQRYEEILAEKEDV